MTRQDILDLIENALSHGDADCVDWIVEANNALSALEEAGLLWTPENNTTQWDLLTSEQQEALNAAKHGWETYSAYDGWEPRKKPMWIQPSVYRAKPAPRTVSSWVNVYPCDDVEVDGVDLSPPYPDRQEADACAGSNRSHVIRLDLTDGVLTTHVDDPEAAQ